MKIRKVISLRESQTKAFEQLKLQNHQILNAPTGWGKSMVLCALAADDLLKNPERKVVIAIPQTIIAKGFVKEFPLQIPTGKTVKWEVKYNLCDDSSHKTEQLKKLLCNPVADHHIFNRIIVTTHIGLARAFKDLKGTQFDAAIANTTFMIDEAHHISASDASCNQLGKIIQNILENDTPKSTTSLTLATAFFFRGDHSPIVKDEHLDRFVKHSIPFDEYWKSLKYIKSYKYDFVPFKGTVWKPLTKLLGNDQCPTIVYCPPKSHRLLLGKEKSEFTDRIIRNIKRHYPDAELWSADSENSGRVILDLVDEDYRTEKIQYAMTYGHNIDAILTVGLFKEGADWIQAQRVIDFIPSGSDQDRNQRFGRLIRDYPGKTNVSYFSFFPVITDGSKDEQRKYLSKIYAHFHASLILENALKPIKMPQYYNDKHRSGGKQGRPIDLLGRYSQETQESILSNSCDALISLTADCESENRKPSSDEVRGTIIRVLHKHDVNEDEEQTAKQIILLIRRRSNINLDVDDLIKSGFDKVWSDDTLEGLRLFSAGFGGPSRFAELRDIISDIFETKWGEYFNKIKDLPECPPQNSRAYWWITNNKSFHRDGKLSKKRANLLESIPWWSWCHTYDDRWQEYYKELIQYKEYPTKLSKQLENWTGKQRLNYKDGNISQDRIQLLESIEWWQWKPDKWLRNFKAVSQLKEKPKNIKSNRLARWVYNQILAKRENKLSANKIRKLESIQWWSWGEDDWQRKYELIKTFNKRPTPSMDKKANEWFYTQRKAYKRNSLTPDKIKMLESIPWWSWA